MGCKTTLNVQLLNLDCGSELLHISFPVAFAHTNHSPTSLADLHSQSKGFMFYLRKYTSNEGGKDSKVLRFVSETLVSFLIEPASNHVKHIV